MVKNHSCVLDEGVLKSIPEVKCSMKYEEKLLNMWRRDALTHHCKMKGYEDSKIEFEDRGDDEWFDESCKYWDFPHDTKVRYREALYEKIKSYYNWIPFTPFVVFNVSPHWKGCGITGKPNPLKIEYFEKTIKEFFAISHRFRQVDYALECGSNGDHLHAHIVAQINADQLSTVVTQLQKGNLTNGFRKIWLKTWPEGPEGTGGILKGKFAIQTSLMRKEEFLRDKLNYLEEDKKPADHKNLYDLEKRETIYF